MDLNRLLDCYVERVKYILGDRLECVVLTGSYARGDFTSKSDIDLWIIIKDMKLHDIKAIGKDSLRDISYKEINPQCISFDELSLSGFKNSFNPVQLYLDGVVIFGDLQAVPLDKRVVAKEASRIFTQVLMSIRHYIVVNEPEENLRKSKIRSWLLKPVLWGLRYYLYCSLDIYCRTFSDLKRMIQDAEVLDWIKVYEALLDDEYYKGDCDALLSSLHDYTSAKLIELEGWM